MPLLTVDFGACSSRLKALTSRHNGWPDAPSEPYDSSHAWPAGELVLPRSLSTHSLGILTPSTHGNALRKAWQKSSKRVAFTTREQDLPQQHKLLLGKSVTQHRLLTQPKKQLTRTLLAIFIELSLFTLDDFESTIPKLDRNLADTHVKICLFFALWSHYALRNNLDAAYTWLGFLCASSALQVFVHGNQRLKPFNLDSQEPENDISPHIGRFACDQGLSKEETQAIVTQIGCRLGKNRKKANNNKTWRFVQDLHY